MSKIDKLKRFLQENYPNEQAFNTRNIAGDSMGRVYDEDGITVDYCYQYSYIEIFGLTDEEFEDLIDEYGHLKNFNIGKESYIMKEKTADEIKIKLKDIAKLQHLYIEIFTEEDEDYPDRRVISNKERAVQRILDKITDKRFNQIEIWKVIQLKSWDDTDNTFKPICNRLRELGYEIINNN